MKQMSFSSVERSGHARVTRREKFLGEMERLVPWARLLAVLEPHHPRGGKRGRPPIGLERMLRMYFVQQWYGLSDEGLTAVFVPGAHAMVPDLSARQTDIRRLCHQHHVRRLTLFGSAVTGNFDPARSDLDFVVEFEELPPPSMRKATSSSRKASLHCLAGRSTC